jgi:hypothetical protein
MISALNKTNTLSWIFIVIVSLQLGRIILTLSKPDFWTLELLRQCGILLYHVWVRYLRKIPVLRLNFPRHSSQEIFRLSTVIFRKYLSQTYDFANTMKKS